MHTDNSVTIMSDVDVVIVEAADNLGGKLTAWVDPASQHVRLFTQSNVRSGAETMRITSGELRAFADAIDELRDQAQL